METIVSICSCDLFDPNQSNPALEQTPLRFMNIFICNEITLKGLIRTWVGNKIPDLSDVVGAVAYGAVEITSSFST